MLYKNQIDDEFKIFQYICIKWSLRIRRVLILNFLTLILENYDMCFRQKRKTLFLHLTLNFIHFIFLTYEFRKYYKN